MAVVALLFIQEVAAQGVSTVLRDKEKRQILYSGIINDDERFTEFMKAVKASGRAEEGVVALDKGKAEMKKPSAVAGKVNAEEQLAISQMVSLMKEMAEGNPELQKVIDEKYPGVGNLIRNGKQGL